MLTIQAQEKKPIFKGIYTQDKYKTISTESMKGNNWNVNFEFMYKKSKTDIFQTKQFKQLQTQKKLAAITDNTNTTAEKKYRTLAPTVGTNFKGNELKSWTPTDNTVAISNSGYIVSCVNWGIEFYDTAANVLLFNQTWDGFINDSTLAQPKFDPRVIYDNKNNRFILVLLHGFSSTTNKIVICFSKTDNPMDGWNVYRLSGNPYNDTAWTDYPVIGLNDDDLFISGNRFGDPPSYSWKGAYIYQVSMANGYAGTPIQFGIWNNIYAPDGEEAFTIYPASQGLGKSLVEKMYFVHLRPDTGSKVYVYELTGKLQSPVKTFTAKQFNIPHYDVCGNAFEKDPTTGNIDSLSTASAMVQNAYYNNKMIHFTFSADISNGWCGLHYGRVKLDSNKAVVKAYGLVGTDMSYPAVAAFGRDTNDQSAVIAFLRSDSTITPECDVIGVDHKMVFSTHSTVKLGDTVVNILYPPAYPIMPERWGDYTGIARKYDKDTPEVWMAGAYGANTLPRRASYGTWIAQLKNENAPLSLAHTDKGTSNMNLYPNPITDMFTIEFEAKQHAQILVALYDVQGKKIKTLFDDHIPESRCRLSFNKLMLPNGLYYVQVVENNVMVQNQKLLVTH
jgi:Secretion system C-terminal sorting domain